MQTYIKTHNVYRFQFASSICNGNLKEFKKLLKLISDYNEQVNAQASDHLINTYYSNMLMRCVPFLYFLNNRYIELNYQ
jgi:hypothetical protein